MADSAAAPLLAVAPAPAAVPADLAAVSTTDSAAAPTPATSWAALPAAWSALPAGARQTTAAPAADAKGAPVWVVVRVDGPPTVAPSAAVTVTALVTNVSGETARGVRLEVRNSGEARLVGRAVYQLAEIAPGAQTTVAVTGDVLTRPGERLQAQLVATGGNLASDAVGSFTPLVRQDVADTWEPGPGAGLWRTPSGFLEIELPADRDAVIKRISQRGLYEAVQFTPGALQRFEVTAEDEAGTAIHNFATPVTLRWRYAEALAAAPPRVAPVFAWWNERTQAWERLSTRVDAVRGVIETQVKHFSQFGVLPGMNQAPADPFSGLDADLFSGSLNYAVPLPLATRPGGFAPGLALNYSSRRRDSQDGYGSAGALIGFGWRLDGLDSIDAVPGGYALALGGATLTIKRTAAWVWYAEEAPGLQISRASSAEDADWHVRTPDGTHRIFTKVQTYWDCDTTPEPDVPRERVKTFMLTSITAPADDGTYSYSINFTYNSDPNITYTRSYNFYCAGNLTRSYTFQALPTQATYNGVNGHSVVVDFGYNTRTDMPAACQTPTCTGADNDQFWYYYTRRLQDVTLKVDGQSMQRYHLTTSIAAPDSEPRHYRLLLDNVQSFGKNDALAQPPVSFTYKNAPGCQTGDNCRLETLNNGQGGLATCTYAAQGGAPLNTYRLDSLTLRDQVTGSEIRRAFWYNQWDTSAGGYDFVIVTHQGDLATTADDLLDKHWYYISPNNTLKGRWGQEYQAAHSDVNGKALDLTVRTLIEPPLPSGSPYQNVRYVVDTVRSSLYDANGANPQQSGRQGYAYALDHQDNVQAGNVTHLREYDASDTLVRTTERWYHPCLNCNGSRYIADRVAEEKVWQGDVTGTCKAHTRYYYDNQASYVSAPLKGLLTKVEAAQSTCGTGFIIQTQNTYDATWHNLTRTQDGLGHGISYTYDTEFRAFVTTATNDLSQVTTTAYPSSVPNDVVQRALGWPSQVTDANGQATQFTYDALGRPLSVDRPLGAATDEEWVYSDYTSPASPRRLLHKVRDDITTPANPESGYLAAWTYYDGLGRLLQTQGEDAAGNGRRVVASRQYDGYGRLWRESVPYQDASNSPGDYKAENWNTAPPTHTRYSYDLLGRPAVVTRPDNATLVRTFYDRLKTLTLDELNHQTIQETDAFGRLSSSQQYSGTFASPNWGAEVYTSALYTYNVRDQLTQVIANNLTTQLSYDLLGRKTALTDPNMGAWNYSYDAAGNLLTQNDAWGCGTTFGYDALNRLTGKSYSGSGACAGTPAVTFTYDQGTNGKGRRTAMTYGSGYATTWRYDARGRVISETQTIATTAYTTLSGYDAADRLRTLTYPGGEVVTTTYSSQGLATSLVGANVYVQSTDYDAAGRVISRTVGSGTAQWQTQYSYYPWTMANGQGRLQQLRSGTTAQPGQWQDLSYTYDAVGNVRTILDAVNSSQRQCFQYDPLDRLTRATTSADSGQGCSAPVGAGNYSEGYEYYKGGSLKRKGAADNAADGLYTYDANHPHAAATYRGNSYSYDADGNMTGRVVSGVTSALTYNAENRLTQVVSGTLTASYVYDGDGNRVRSVITASGAVTETHYVGQHYEKTLNSGDTKYYYLAGQLVAFERSAGYGVDWGRRFVFRDHLGSTNVIINAASGVLLWRDRYLPFGDVRDTYRKDNNPSFSLQTQYRFTGQRLESRLGTPAGGLDRGLYFYGARWYDSSLGRFIQADTIVPNPGDPQSLNRYSYVLNNALRYTDPTGHCALIDEEANGLCVRYAQDGTLRIVHGGTHFANPVETGIANALLSGDTGYLNAIPAGTNPLSLQQSVDHVTAELGLSDAGTGTGQFRLDSALIVVVGMAIVKGLASEDSGGSWLSYVPERYRASVVRAFAGTPTVETLSEDLVVYRHWGGEAPETGSPYFSPKPYVRPGNARRYLALPRYNSASNVSVFKIKAGTTIVRGEVASQVGQPKFGPYAAGGGMQIYLPHPDDAVLIGPLDVTK